VNRPYHPAVEAAGSREVEDKVSSLPALIAFVLLLASIGLCVPREGRRIQGDVQERASVALTASAISWAEVTADGRFVTITGTAPSPEARLRVGQLVAAVPGVVQVDNRLTVRGPLDGPGS